MEHDRINHGDGNRLSPFLIAHPSPSFQRETRSLKYLNGSRSAERAPVQVNGEIKCTPSRRGFNHTKGAQKNCNSPALPCEKKESPKLLHNGAIKRMSSEPCITGGEKTKKGRKYEDLNGGNVGTRNKTGAPLAERKKQEEKVYFKIRRSSRLTCGRYEYPEYEGQHQEDPMDNNYNSDSASPITNNTVTLSNGANDSTSSKESVNDELLKETLSHCEQERNCSTVQNISPHTDAINSNAPLPPENAPSPHTSGQIISPNACNTELQHVPVIMVPEVHNTEKLSKPRAMMKELPDHDSQKLPVECRNAQEAEDSALTGTLACDDRIDLKISNHSSGSPLRNSGGNSTVFKENPAFRKAFSTPLLPSSNSFESMLAEDYSYCNQRGENLSEAKDGTDRGHNRPGSQSPNISQQSQCFLTSLHDTFSNDSLLMLASLSALESLDALRGSPEKILQKLQAPLNRDERLPHHTRIGTGTRTEGGPFPEKQKQLSSNSRDFTSQANQNQGGADIGGSSFPQMSNSDTHKSVIQSPSRTEEHGLFGQHTGSPGVLKHVGVQDIHRIEHTSDLYKNDSPKLCYPAAEDQGHAHIQKPSPHGQPQTTDSSSNINTQQHNQHWSSDYSQQRQQVEQALNPQFKPQHLNPQIAEAESFLNACFSQQSQKTPDPCPRERSVRVPDQQHIFRGKLGEKLPVTLSQTQIKSELPTFSQTKLEEFIHLEKQYTKPTQSQSHTQETGLAQSPHQNRKLSYSPIPQPSNSHARNPFSDIEKKETAVIRELFAYKKTPDPQHTPHYPNNKTLNSNAHSFSHGKEPQMDPGLVPPFPLQPKQEYCSLMPNLSNKRSAWSPHPRFPQGMGSPPHTLDHRGSHYPHLNSGKAFKKHSALRTHLLHKLKQRKELSHSLHKPIKIEANLYPSPCNRSHTPIRTPEKKPGRKIKQEIQPFEPNHVKQRSIIETMEQQLKQYQVKTLYSKKAHRSKSPKHVKVETSGSLTVLTTHARPTDHNGYLLGLDQQPTYPSEKTPTKRTSGSYLHNFLESPSTLFDTPIKSLLDTPAKTQYDFASCSCVDQIIEKDEGPYYTHLGAGPSMSAVREVMEERFGEKGDAIRLERVIYTGKEGRSSQGCPIAKWVIRRSSKTEKLLCIVRERTGHSCETAVLVIAILVWEGIPRTLADKLYSDLTDTLPKYGAMTARRCALNEERTCACQGLDPDTCGASFSFGCSWSMYYNGCKFARSKVPRRFKLFADEPWEEERLEANLQNLSTLMAPTYKKMAPDAYNNQIEHEHRAPDCRLGLKEGRPFSGVTACLDFCAHAHRDLHNMQNGSTLVCTLTSEDNREVGKIPEDEQLHVLPLYRISSVDEFGSAEGQQKKMQSGGIQVLHSFRRKVRKHSAPVKTCRQKKLEAKKAAAERHADKHSVLVNGSSKSEKERAPRQKHSESATEAKQLAELLRLSGPATELQEQKQSKNPESESTYPGTDSSAHYMRQPPPPYQSSPKAPDPYGGQHQMNMYSSPSRASSSHLNSSSSINPYSAPLNQSNQCATYPYNGSLISNGCPPPPYRAYPSHAQHMDIYRSQDPHMLPYQTPYQQRYGHKYLNYGNQNTQADKLSGCSPGPNVHHSDSYSPYPSHQADSSFIEAAPTLKSSQNNFPMDYSTVHRKGEYTPHSSPYHAHGGPSVAAMYGGSPNAMQLQRKGNSNSVTDNRICNMLPAFNHDRTTPSHEALLRTNGAKIHEYLPETPLKNQTHEEEAEGVWSDSEQSFLDSEIGGVAVAPTHGSILIECAKRELHATTPLKNPNRHHPTRISLVFYQHKSMNEPKHGLALWEAKMADKAREKEEDYERYGPDYVAPKSGQKKVKRELNELLVQEPSEQNYMRFIKSLSQRTMSITTNSTSTSTPYAFTQVTGPYHRYI